MEADARVPSPDQILTVGELREALAGLGDDEAVGLFVIPEGGIAFATDVDRPSAMGCWINARGTR